MERMTLGELRSLDDDTLISWLEFLTRFHAEDIGLHLDAYGNLQFGDRRPRLEEVEDELVRRGLDSRPDFLKARSTARESDPNQSAW